MRLEPEQVGIGLGRPAGPRQQVMRDDVARRPDERLEQPEFRRREDERRLADAGLVTGRLEDEVAGRQRSGRRRARPRDRRAA